MEVEMVNSLSALFSCVHHQAKPGFRDTLDTSYLAGYAD